MSREIEFRFWLLDKEVMSSNYTIASLLDGGWYDIGRHVVMQYTGLKDKNGTKIFEGDILQYVSEDKLGSIRGPVEFKNGKFSVPIRKGKNPLDMAIGTPSFHTKHVVVGNIYEDPELLTKSV